jgi:hypothetical protein
MWQNDCMTHSHAKKSVKEQKGHLYAVFLYTSRPPLKSLTEIPAQ